MLKREQFRPFLFGALFTAGASVITYYAASHEGYMACVNDVVETHYSDELKEVQQDKLNSK